MNIKLSDGQIYEAAIELSSVAKFKMEDDMAIINTNNTQIIDKLSEFAIYYKSLKKPQQKLFDNINELEMRDKNIYDWCINFGNMEPCIIGEILNISYELELRPLLDLGCYILAKKIENMSPTDISKMLDIQCDLTEQEKDEINKSAFWNQH